MYRSRIRLVSEPEVVVHSKDPFSPTAYLRLKNLVLEAKPLDEVYQTAEQLLSLERIHTNDQSSSCVSNRRPFISPFKRLEDIQLKTCEEIRGDIVCTVFPKRNSDDGGNNSKKHNHRGFDKTNLKSIKNVGRRLSNEIWITSNYSSTSESLHKIHEATENAFLQMKSVFASNGIRPQQILQIIAVLNQSLSSDVFNTFNKAYALQLDRWLREDVNNKTSREHEVVSSYMPTRVCICMNSISHEISVHSKEAFCVNLSAIIYYGNVDICGWIDSLRGLYVQSISHWAPANIGPYSQAIAVPLSFVQSDDCSSPSSTEYFTFYSGQIGLIPELEVLPSQNDHFMNSF
ncbi:unnamed protein product [Heterobilharzia americana]|nr:unnamed protein product [Heterobilharzia americana]